MLFPILMTMFVPPVVGMPSVWGMSSHTIFCPKLNPCCASQRSISLVLVGAESSWINLSSNIINCIMDNDQLPIIEFAHRRCPSPISHSECWSTRILGLNHRSSVLQAFTIHWQCWFRNPVINSYLAILDQHIIYIIEHYQHLLTARNHCWPSFLTSIGHTHTHTHSHPFTHTNIL